MRVKATTSTTGSAVSVPSNGHFMHYFQLLDAFSISLSLSLALYLLSRWRDFDSGISDSQSSISKLRDECFRVLLLAVAVSG